MSSNRSRTPASRRPMTRYGRCSARRSTSVGEPIESEGFDMNDLATTAGQPGAADDAPATRQRSFAGRALRGVVTLLPGILLLAFWQWASGRLIREIYVSK